MLHILAVKRVENCCIGWYSRWKELPAFSSGFQINTVHQKRSWIDWTWCWKNWKTTIYPSTFCGNGWDFGHAISRAVSEVRWSRHVDLCSLGSGINSLIDSVSLASHVSTYLLVHLSAHLCHHHHSHYPSLLHSFTPGSKPTFSTNPSHLNTSTLDCLHYHGTGPDLSCFLTLLPWTAFTITGPDRTYHASRFIFSSFFSFNFFLFVSCGGLSWLHVGFLLHNKYTISYHSASSQTLACNVLPLPVYRRWSLLN